jgi:hypothetical protein
VGHLAAGRVDAEGADLPDIAVGGVHVPAAALLHLARRDDVDGFLLRDPGELVALRDQVARAAPAGRQQLNGDLVAERELSQGLLRGLKVPELRLGAAQPDLARCYVGKVQRHQPGQPAAALRLDHQVSYRAGGRIENDGTHLPAIPVAAYSRTAQDKRYHHEASFYRDPNVWTRVRT